MSDTVIEGEVTGIAQQSYEDYWGTDETHRFTLPDGKQWIEFKIMNEGAKARFQKLTNSDLMINKGGEAKVRMDPANERHTLIKESVVDWLLYKDGQDILFSSHNLNKWLDVAPPKVVEDLEFEIRKANPWMQADMKVEDIDKEIDRLLEMKRDLQERQQGE